MRLRQLLCFHKLEATSVSLDRFEPLAQNKTEVLFVCRKGCGFTETKRVPGEWRLEHFTTPVDPAKCKHDRRQGVYYISGPGISSPVYVCDDCKENSLNNSFTAKDIWEMD